MKALVVFSWLMPAAVAALLYVPVQTANARGMGGGGVHMGGGGGHMGAGHIGGLRSHPGAPTHFFSRTGASRFGHQNLAFRNHNFDRFNRGDRFADRRDQFRDSHGLPDRGADRRDRFADRGERFRNGRFGEERFEHRFGEERFERNFFFRHNFFVGFNFGAFGWWPWWGWGWGGPGWWGWDGYPYAYGDGGYYSNYGDPPASQGNSSQKNGSQYDAQYWNNLAMSVQTKLADQGYYHGQVDGVIGSGTIEAVRKFQADHSLTVTGKIDPKLLNALGITYETPSSTKEPSPNNEPSPSP